MTNTIKSKLLTKGPERELKWTHIRSTKFSLIVGWGTTEWEHVWYSHLPMWVRVWTFLGWWWGDERPGKDVGLRKFGTSASVALCGSREWVQVAIGLPEPFSGFDRSHAAGHPAWPLVCLLKTSRPIPVTASRSVTCMLPVKPIITPAHQAGKLIFDSR